MKRFPSAQRIPKKPPSETARSRTTLTSRRSTSTNRVTAGGVELNFRDTYKFNIAAYRLDKLLGLNMVPVTVERKVAGQTAAVAWWVDDVLMMEKDRYLKGIEPPDQEAWNRQIYQARAFQQLIANSDPNLGNFIITKDWKLWTVDFTRAFRSHKDVATRELNCIDPRTHEALKKLDKRILERELGSFLGNWEMEGLLARRDKIVEFFERKAAEQGKEKAFCAVRAGLVVNNEHQAL